MGAKCVSIPRTARRAVDRRWLAIACGLLLLTVQRTQAEQRDIEEDRSVAAGVQQHGIDPNRFDPEVVVAWNRIAHDVAFAEDQFLTFKGQRGLAMMHLAMHDALNAIVPVYESYAYHGRHAMAHPVAAAAQAAYEVLATMYPMQDAVLAQELTRSLAGIPTGPSRDSAVAVGHAAAMAIAARRAGDAWDFPGTYEFSDRPGRYQTTPPWNGFVAQPGFRFARPFVLEYPQQFRPSPPPPLRNRTYARAFQEIKELGAPDSTVRTEDQTGYAIWWMEFAEGSVNRLARELATERHLGLWRAARLFAHVGSALYDTYVATWDAKYFYDHWRPYTAVRGADLDGNRSTTSSDFWESLRPAPPFPEYTSAHAAACAATFAVLENTFGSRTAFTMTTTTAPPGMPTRTFESFRSAAAECADSRVRLGWHFRYSTDAGLALGHQVARYALRHALQVRRRW